MQHEGSRRSETAAIIRKSPTDVGRAATLEAGATLRQRRCCRRRNARHSAFHVGQSCAPSITKRRAGGTADGEQLLAFGKAIAAAVADQHLRPAARALAEPAPHAALVVETSFALTRGPGGEADRGNVAP